MDSENRLVREHTVAKNNWWIIYESPFSIIQNTSGNFMVLGFQGDSLYNEDYFLVNIDAAGNVVWQKPMAVRTLIGDIR